MTTPRPATDWTAFLKALQRYGKIEAACFKSGIPYQSVVYHRNHHPEFGEAMKNAQASQKGMVRVMYIDSVLEEDGEGQLIVPKPHLIQPLDELVNAEDHAKNATIRHEHAVYFFDVPDTPVLPALAEPTLDAEYRELEDE